jgi:CubicO group peptidase (beta-lactamase class C family)
MTKAAPLSYSRWQAREVWKRGKAVTTVTPASVGMDSEAMEAVTSLFWSQIKEERLHPGAALAVYRDGKLVLDLFGGFADNQTGRAVAEDTMFVLFSSTKPLASMSVLQLYERGKLDLDDPVEKHWPGFGKKGKEGVTVRHVLTHKGGFPYTPAGLGWDKWRDWDAVVAAMEDAEAVYAPGSESAYHALNHGWVCAEFVRRVDGRPFPQYLRESITGPLGMNDTYVGLPAELEDRVAKLHAMEDVPDLAAATVRNFNRAEVHQAVVPAGCGIATARDMARFYAALVNGGELDGVRILREETVRMATEIAVENEMDRTLNQPMRRGTGFNLGGLARPAGGMDLAGADRMGRNATSRTFGHGGAGTSICWADWDLRLAMVFIPNGYRGQGIRAPAGSQNLMVKRCADISDAVRAACR